MKYKDTNGKEGTRMMRGVSGRLYGDLAALAKHGNTEFLKDGISVVKVSVEPPPSLSKLKTIRKAELEKAAAAVSFSGVVVNIGGEAVWYDTSPYSLDLVNGAVTQYLMNGKLPPYWKGRDPKDVGNKKRPTITAEELKMISNAIATHVEDAYIKLDGYKIDVDAASSKAEVAAVVWV